MHYAYFSRCNFLVWPHTIPLITWKCWRSFLNFWGFLHHKWQVAGWLNAVRLSTAAVKHVGSSFIVWWFQFVSADCCLSKCFLAFLVCMTLLVNVCAKHLPTLMRVFSLCPGPDLNQGKEGGYLSAHDPARCIHCTAECCLVSLKLFLNLRLRMSVSLIFRWACWTSNREW